MRGFETEAGIGGLVALKEDGEHVSAALLLVELVRGDFESEAGCDRTGDSGYGSLLRMFWIFQQLLRFENAPRECFERFAWPGDLPGAMRNSIRVRPR